MMYFKFKRPGSFLTDRSQAILLLQFFVCASVVSCVAFVLSLCVFNHSFF